MAINERIPQARGRRDRARLPHQRQFEEKLRRAVNAWERAMSVATKGDACSEWDDLYDFTEGTLADAKEQSIEKHIFECDYCAGQVLKLYDSRSVLTPEKEKAAIERAFESVERM